MRHTGGFKNKNGILLYTTVEKKNYVSDEKYSKTVVLGNIITIFVYVFFISLFTKLHFVHKLM